MPGKRMFKHDYSRVGFYMITIVSAGRKRLFGTCKNNQAQLSEAGKTVLRRWKEIPEHRPAVEANTCVIMPDHLHGIVYVRKKLTKPVGETIRGFKSGVTSELRRQLKTPSLNVWEEGYHDRVIMDVETLRTERAYINDNPRRYCLRKENPQMFLRANYLTHDRLPAESDILWAGFGNLFLLDKPALAPLQVSRRVSSQELACRKAEALELSWRGAVLASPFISPGEKEIAHALMNQEYGSLILLRSEGFPPLYKPPGAYFDLCAQGRLLVLSPFAYTGRKQPLTRERCLRMNQLVAEMCGCNARL